VVTFRLEPKALGVFRQKYGEIHYQEAIEGLHTATDRVLKDEMPDALVERRGEGCSARPAMRRRAANVLASRIRARA